MKRRSTMALALALALLLAAFNIGMFNLTDEQAAAELAKIEAEEGNGKSMAELDT